MTPLSRLRRARSIYGFYGAEGRALRDAVDAARTQRRLLPLVEALHHRHCEERSEEATQPQSRFVAYATRNNDDR